MNLAEAIFGQDIGYLKGHSARTKPLPIATDQVEVPKALYEHRCNLVLCMDGMTVNAMSFLTTITKEVMYRTAQATGMKIVESRETLDNVLRMHNKLIQPKEDGQSNVIKKLQ